MRCKMNKTQKQVIRLSLPRYLTDMEQFAQQQDVARATGTLYGLLNLLARSALSPEQQQQVKQITDLHLQALYGTSVDEVLHKEVNIG